MHLIFADPSGFFTSVNDVYLCERDEPGVPVGQCSINPVGIFGERQGNPDLEEEEGDSLTVGFVIEPIDNLTITADYWEIDLQNIVIDEPLSEILQLEADCRLGRQDINSGECQDALARVIRRPASDPVEPEALVQVNTGPINAAFNKVNGIDASLDYVMETDGAGTFALNLGWTHTLGDDFRLLPEDPVENLRDQSINWRSRVRGSLGWSYGDFRATLFGERFGSTRSYEGRVLDEFAEEPRMGPQMYYNLTAGYTFLDGKADVSLIVNNLFDEKPPIDQEWSGWPYFSFFNYYQFALGQSYAIQLDYRFDY
jgi:outer membrane receptor protein involved in Fe transport